jgi:hypothetical protein
MKYILSLKNLGAVEGKYSIKMVLERNGVIEPG